MVRICSVREQGSINLYQVLFAKSLLSDEGLFDFGLSLPVRGK
jgi:hypothetical protein